MKTEEKFDLLFDGVNTLLDISEKNEDEFKKVLIEMSDTSAALKSSASNVHRNLKREVQSSADSITEQVVNGVLKNLNEANKAANEAADAYKKAVRISVFKLYGLFFLFSIFSATFIWYFFIKEIPTISELRELRETRAYLSQEVEKLELYGNINTCDGKLCVKIDKSECDYSVKSEPKSETQSYCKVVPRF
ncbi:hypothetical protein [Pseudoalteromonas sp. OF7H-1]|uniref:hypothetical protein n=1 Tax=Pseudoalteromonas sp. OF7H-1 TaxID=2917755 RepID=UPI001EF636C1|nr:hypothetical protein [Pseudoalteromonas sp. OF7H-1]MCG7539039.1 hypothetical protein [Pseudoalteromonas sp. OF7H-1]